MTHYCRIVQGHPIGKPFPRPVMTEVMPQTNVPGLTICTDYLKVSNQKRNRLGMYLQFPPSPNLLRKAFSQKRGLDGQLRVLKLSPILLLQIFG